MELSSILPWGRSFDEYRRMFDLTAADLSGRILGCADGPASFNAEATALGHRVISCDPIYAFDAHQIRRRIDESHETIVTQAARDAHRFVWTHFPNAEELGRARLATMRLFLTDFERRAAPPAPGRYVAAALPHLPFGATQFDLCLCSHLLFLYSARLDLDFHLAAVTEMLRVARQVRIFPLLDLAGAPSPHVEPLCSALRRQTRCHVALRDVPYEFQRGGNRMMVLAANEQATA